MAYSLDLASAFAALADPTRRTLFERLAREPASVGALAAGMTVTRPAVSQHLRVLKDAGLVQDEAQGTRRVYRIDPRGIGVMRNWLDQHWAAALDAFQAYADTVEEEPQ